MAILVNCTSRIPLLLCECLRCEMMLLIWMSEGVLFPLTSPVLYFDNLVLPCFVIFPVKCVIKHATWAGCHGANTNIWNSASRHFHCLASAQLHNKLQCTSLSQHIDVYGASHWTSVPSMYTDILGIHAEILLEGRAFGYKLFWYLVVRL